MRVLIAIDDTEASSDAVTFAKRLLDGADHQVTVLNVAEGLVPVPVTWTSVGAVPAVGVSGFASAAPGRLSNEAAEQRMEDANRLVDAAGAEVDAEQRLVESGEAVTTICAVAAENDADLIVVGSHDKGWFTRWLSGSVSHSLVSEAPCPVLVVR